MDAVIFRQHPNSLFQGIPGCDSEQFYSQHTNSKELAHLMIKLSSYKGRNAREFFDVPFFGNHEERMKFMEDMHHFFWSERCYFWAFDLEKCFGIGIG